jgi:hypothetical protein
MAWAGRLRRPVIAILAASIDLSALARTAVAADPDAQTESPIPLEPDESSDIDSAPAPVVSPSSAATLPADAGESVDTAACDRDLSPSFRRGFLVLTYAGWQFPVEAAAWITNGYRFGGLLGGHLSEHLSLSADLGFATWTWNRNNHRAGQFDVGATLLLHAGGPRAEIIVGPKLGKALIFRNDYNENTHVYVNGWQMGVKAGVLLALSGAMALGIVADLSYTINPVELDASCFYNESSDCTRDTRHTVLGSLAAAVLF